MKTYKQFQENVVTSILKSKPAQQIMGKTNAGRFVRSFALPDTISGTKIPFTNLKIPKNKFTKTLDLPYQAATDSMFTGPAAPVTFATSLAARAYGPSLSKLGKEKEKARLDTRKDMLKGLEKSGDKNAQFNVDRYMSNFKGVNNKSLYPSPIPKV